MNSGSRKHHTKSRNGCDQCKVRRVRCNCIGPSCSNCRRRKEQCSFLAENEIEHCPAPSVASPAPPTLTASCSSLPAVTQSQPSILPPFISYNFLQPLTTTPFRTMEEHSLMCHFIENTAPTLVLSPARVCPQQWRNQVCWQTVMSCHPYVTQSLISVSALHMCHLGPPNTRPYYSAACSNYLRASKGFRETVLSIDDSNWLPTLLFSLSALIFHFYIPFAATTTTSLGQPSSSSENKDFNPMEVIFILRSAGTVLTDIGPLLLKTGLLLEPPNRSTFCSESDSSEAAIAANAQRFDSLKMLVEKALVSENERVECMDALSHLLTWATKIHGRPQSWKDFRTWPQKVSPGFLQQLSLRSIPAVDVFNQWCAIMKQAPDTWYLGPWLARASGS